MTFKLNTRKAPNRRGTQLSTWIQTELYHEVKEVCGQTGTAVNKFVADALRKEVRMYRRVKIGKAQDDKAA